MDLAKMRVEDLLPHRDRMRLVDEIMEVNAQRAVTLARVTDQWPFFDGGAVSSLVSVELVAETAGINNSWGGKIKHGENFATMGWLVGIKESRFYIPTIPLHACLITRSANAFELDSYRVVKGSVGIDNKIVAEVKLQLVQSTPA